MKKPSKSDNIKGISIALLVIILWGASLIGLLALNATGLPVFLIIPAMLWQTFLYTGLFITAHDAMHRTIFPRSRKINNAIGSLAVKLYALFSYSKLLEKHWAHHRNPASRDDPDFHDGQHRDFFRWYFHFMRGYITWKQILGMAIAFNLFIYVFNVPTINIILFWIAPSLLSTVQLFYFGTYLPHRESEAGYKDQHRARSNDYGVLWSFLTCYHFGYHWEHHEYPYVPWWRLPAMRRQVIISSRSPEMQASEKGQ